MWGFFSFTGAAAHSQTNKSTTRPGTSNWPETSYWIDKYCGPHSPTVDEASVKELDSAGEKNAEVIPAVACAVANGGEMATVADLNDLQSILLDRYKKDFFSQWVRIPKEKKETAEKFNDFIFLTGGENENLKNKIRLYEDRLNLLIGCPLKLKGELALIIESMKARLAEIKKEFEKKADEAEIPFKLSNIREKLSEKLTSNPLSKATVFANEIMLNEGLNFKGYLKSENNNWHICSASTALREESCQTTSVSFNHSRDSCGSYAILGVLLQADNNWFVMSGSSSYRINLNETMSTRLVTLEKDGVIQRSWNIPEGFNLEYLGTDLHSLYARTIIRDRSGKYLTALHLVMRENGRFQFAEPTKVSKDLILLFGKDIQNVKGLDGSKLEIHFKKKCEG